MVIDVVRKHYFLHDQEFHLVSTIRLRFYLLDLYFEYLTTKKLLKIHVIFHIYSTISLINLNLI
jgi:hypothetical protein